MISLLSTANGPTGDAAFDVVHGRLLHGFVDVVRELGGDAIPLLARHGIDPATLAKEHAATYHNVIPLLEDAASKLLCPDFGMRLALRQGATGTFGRAGDILRKAPTFGEALQFISSHSQAHSPAAFIWTKRYPSRKELMIGHAILIDGPLIRVQAIEQIFLLGQLMALELSGGHVRSRCIMFRHQPVAPLQAYRRHFGCEVLFGQRADAAIYHDRDLACPLIDGDPRVFRDALADLDRDYTEMRVPLRTRVRVSVTHFLATGLCTRTHVAETMKLHPRTMDRRLDAESTSFLQIRDEVRRDLLRYYVQHTGFDFTDISERLGLSEQSVMTRCSRKWFAMTPSELRAAAAPR